NEVLVSRWDTSYLGQNGQRVAASVEIRETNGSYRIAGGLGRFANIEIKRKEAGFVISGEWQYGNKSGTFSWKTSASKPMTFDGRWKGDDGKQGDWKGKVV